MGIHNYEEKLEQTVSAMLRDNKLSQQNKDTILEFQRYLSIAGYSQPRILKYVDTARRVAHWFKNKDFTKLTREDVLEYLSKVQALDRSEWTKQWYRVFIKRFLQWVHNMSKDQYPDLVKDVKVHFPNRLRKLPNEGEFLTEEDVTKLIEACSNSRDRALVSTLYEGGCRIGELGNMKIRHLKFDEYGAVLTVQGKTGSRNIRIINSTPYLATWLNDHSRKDDREAPLWVNIGPYNTRQQISYVRLRKLISDLGKKAGIKKRCNPHSFRHARATVLADHLTEFQMNQYFGWIQGSNMPATYVHMSGKNTDLALLKLHGIEVDENDKPATMKPKKCPRCTNINSHNSSFCVRCGAVLDPRKAAELDGKRETYEQERENSDRIMNLLLRDPEVVAVIKRKLTGELNPIIEEKA